MPAEDRSRLRLVRFSAKQFPELEEVWRELQQGTDMTAYQSYCWQSIVREHLQRERFSRYLVRAAYYVVFDACDVPLLIAPLRIHLISLSKNHRRGCYLLGRNGYSDYLNFVYRDFSPEAAALVLEQVRKDFRVRDIVFERVLADTATAQWLVDMPTAAVETPEAAVQIMLPDRPAEYMHLLSRGARQNIRTARNRVCTDGLELELSVDSQITEESALAIQDAKARREKARRARDGLRWPQLLRIWVRRQYFAVLFTDYNEALRAMTSLPGTMVITLTDGEAVCAFAFGLVDHYRGLRTLRVLQVGIDDRYSRYSPGMLCLHDFILRELDNARPPPRVVDLTRGAESYKFALGGQRHEYVSATIGAGI